MRVFETAVIRNDIMKTQVNKKSTFRKIKIRSLLVPIPNQANKILYSLVFKFNFKLQNTASYQEAFPTYEC
jgi:hypothetical protein